MSQPVPAKRWSNLCYSTLKAPLFFQCDQLGQVTQLTLAGTSAQPFLLSRSYCILHKYFKFYGKYQKLLQVKCHKEVSHITKYLVSHLKLVLLKTLLLDTKLPLIVFPAFNLWNFTLSYDTISQGILKWPSLRFLIRHNDDDRHSNFNSFWCRWREIRRLAQVR